MKKMAEGLPSSLTACCVMLLLVTMSLIFTLLTHSTLTKILTANRNVISETLKHPLELVGAFKTDTEKYSALNSVIINLAIVLPGPDIRVRIRGTNFYEVDQGMDKCLLSLSLLQSMGFKLKEHLKRVQWGGGGHNSVNFFCLKASGDCANRIHVLNLFIFLVYGR